MQRTFNYTGRSRIEQTQALFSIIERDDGPPEFNVAFRFDASDYPDDALVYVEAYHKETQRRYCFGTIGQISPPLDRRLDSIDRTGPTLFRVLVVDESGRHGRLLARGDQFRAEGGNDDENRSSILAVRKYPMGQLPWRVHFETGAAPELHLNSQITDVIQKMRTDPEFQALILPAALREVLIYYLWNDDDAEGNEHFARWLSFASLFADEPPDSQDPSDLVDWVDEVVVGFSERFKLTDILVDSGARECR